MMWKFGRMFPLKFYFNERACVLHCLIYYVSRFQWPRPCMFATATQVHVYVAPRIGGQVRLHMVVYSADTLLYISLILSVDVH
jgi:hypothetical protein